MLYAIGVILFLLGLSIISHQSFRGNASEKMLLFGAMVLSAGVILLAFELLHIREK